MAIRVLEAKTTRRVLATRVGDALGTAIFGAATVLRRTGTVVDLVPRVFGSTGNRRVGDALLRSATRSDDRYTLDHGHDLAASSHQLQLAHRYEHALDRLGRQPALEAVARRELVTHNPGAAAQVLEKLPTINRSLMRQCDIEQGHYERLLGGDNASDEINPLTRFDAHWADGDVDAALSVGNLEHPATFQSRELFRRLVVGYRTTGRNGELRAAIEHLDARPGTADLAVQCWFDVGDMTKVRSYADDQMLAGGNFVKATADYIDRRFAHSSRRLNLLQPTIKKWDADKLKARILLETAHPAAAFAHRQGRYRYRDVVDEVALYANLQLIGRRAFTDYQHRGLLDAQHSTFPSTVSAVPAHPCDLAVISQDGPGDEIIAASQFDTLITLGHRLTVTCDPRLATLLERSFPEITFVPTTRLGAQPTPGWIHGPARSATALYRLLNAEAEAALRTAPVTVLSRALFSVAPNRAPTAPYLLPSTTLRSAIERRIRPAARRNPIIGVAWRSEARDPMRSVHYVTSGTITELAELGTLLNLQHDIDPDERRELRAAAPDTIFLDDIDLRNDFESLAAVVACCDIVVGPGTTTTELAAAVGATAIMLHPNLFGAWRAGNDHRDAWHQTMLAALPAAPTEPSSCVTAARQLIADEIGSVTPR